jgi:GT2 family glycosyltransferase
VSEVRLSICIVTYRSRPFLERCLESVFANPAAGGFEVIVVDNQSEDGTVEMLQEGYPQVALVRNPANLGYTAPMNQALRLGQGDFLLQLNPDTLVPPGALDRLLAFMDIHPKAGICGPKVLNPDGSMQAQCRRGESRPLAVISYFLGLHRLFPKSKALGGYLLNYLDEDETGEVAGVSGSCMLVRRELMEEIGYLDEQFFAYQEDADYCFRARRAGWKVFYVPEAQITHYGGRGGSGVDPYRSIVEWHRSYWRYYRKNLSQDYPALFNGFYYGLMGVKLVWALGLNALRRGKFAGTAEAPEI